MHPIMTPDEYLTDEVREEHKVCIRGRHRPLVQSRLALTPHSLGFVHPPPRYAVHSPVPNAVKRIRHAPFFSTADRDRTSFLSLPYDIRHQIYDHLLYYGRVHYELCVPTRHLLMRRGFGKNNYPFYRHGLFPAILQCCHTTHDEGAPILYGRNEFFIVNCEEVNDRPYLVLNSWAIGDGDMRRITRITMWPEWGSYAEAPLDGTLGQYCHTFHRLRDVAVNLQIPPEDWAGYVAGNAASIAAIRRLRFNIQVPMTYSDRLWRGQTMLVDTLDDINGIDDADADTNLGEPRHMTNEELVDICLQAYKAPAEAVNEPLGKKMSWDPHLAPYLDIKYIIIDLVWEDP